MGCRPDGKAYRRLNAIHLLLLGAPYQLVLRNSLVSERMLRLWIARFNEQGIDGLIYRPRPGRPRLLEDDVVRDEILPVVNDPSLAGQLHWTAAKLTGWHKSAGLNWHHIQPFYLSPYSPDFNPIERLWQHLKGNAMAT